MKTVLFDFFAFALGVLSFIAFLFAFLYLPIAVLTNRVIKKDWRNKNKVISKLQRKVYVKLSESRERSLNMKSQSSDEEIMSVLYTGEDVEICPHCGEENDVMYLQGVYTCISCRREVNLNSETGDSKRDEDEKGMENNEENNEDNYYNY
jgi:hypothetical protein